MRPNYDHHPLKKLFSALVEHAFCIQVGVCDPKLTEYIVTLLLNFVHVDRLHKFCDPRGKRLESITEILALLDHDPCEVGRAADRDVHRHIGDFALFWAGVYPERLRRYRGSVNPDQLIDFVGRGKESYAIVSTLSDEESDPPRSLFRRLSAEFEVCAHGLGLVRRGWERRDLGSVGGGPHLLY